MGSDAQSASTPDAIRIAGGLAPGGETVYNRPFNLHQGVPHEDDPRSSAGRRVPGLRHRQGRGQGRRQPKTGKPAKKAKADKGDKGDKGDKKPAGGGW